MTTQAQMAANTANAQHSTGPKTAEGLSVSSRNNFRHGLAGAFMVLKCESPREFDELYDNLRAEHAPSTATESLLVERMAQHYWLSQRAIRLQNKCIEESFPTSDDDHCLGLYIRYQTTHERGFHKCLNDLLKLRAEKRKQEIGFESQQHKKAGHIRREAAENRKQEHHRLDILLAEAKLDHQLLQSTMLRFDAAAAACEVEDGVAARKAA